MRKKADSSFFVQSRHSPDCRSADDDDGDEKADTPAAAARRKRKRLPGEDANLRFDEMEAYLQARLKLLFFARLKPR